jgi:hypothetical protein
MPLPSPAFYPVAPHDVIKCPLNDWSNGEVGGTPVLYFTQEVLQWLVNKAAIQPDGTYRIALGTPPIEMVFVPS